MAITYTPTAPVGGDEVTLTLTSGGSATRSPTFELTSVPEESSLSTGIIYDNNGAPTNRFTPDVAGDYGVSGYRYVRRAAPARFDGAASGRDYGYIDAAETATVYVGEALVFDLVTVEGHNATLTLTIANDEVKTATLGNYSTRLAAHTLDDTTVAAKLAALVGESSTTLNTSTLTALVADMRTQYTAHIASGTFHNSADTTNTVSLAAPSTDLLAVDVLNEIRGDLIAHQRTGGAWHDADDTTNYPLVPAATNIRSAHVLYADLWRMYEAHRTQSGVHPTSDTTNTLLDDGSGARPEGPLHDFIFTWLNFIKTPAATGGRAGGLATLEDRYGFRGTQT